jgi:glycerol-3-phosphate cytidylyltransferase
MKRALTFGSFDLLHYGHMRLFSRIKSISDWLIVGLATDELIMEGGKNRPFYPYEIRREMLEHVRIVDEVIEHGGPVDGEGRVKLIAAKVELVRSLHIDLVVMGDDWRGEYDFLHPYCKVLYMDRTPSISTSRIKDEVQTE